MGQLLNRMAEVFASLTGGTPKRIVMLGLDAAGKTTIFYKVKLNETVNTIPTIGFNVETLTPVEGLTFTVWDVGGQKKIRALWKHHLECTDGLLFIVDSADADRMEDAKEELSNVINHEGMLGVPVVVVANKQDLQGAAPTTDIAEKLGLLGMRDRKWHVQGACATSGDGVYEAMHEMARLVKETKKG